MNIDVLEAVGRVAMGSVFAWTFFAAGPDVTTPYLGVPLNVLVACSGGAYASFSFGDKVEPRKRMFQLFFACILMGGAFTAVLGATIAYWFKGFHLTPGVQSGVGAIVSCLMRFLIPAIIERIGPLLDKLPMLRKKQP